MSQHRSRLFMIVTSASIALTVAAGPAVLQAAENRGLCGTAEDAQPVETDLNEDIEWCFDGDNLILQNRSDLVFEVSGGRGISRTKGPWSPGADAVLARDDSAGVMPPGYTVEIRVTPGRTQIRVAVRTDLSETFLLEQTKAWAYGLTPAGDAIQFVEGWNAYAGETDQVDANLRDCLSKASDFWARAGCNLGHFGNTSVAVGRAVVASTPVVNDVSKIVRRSHVWAGRVISATNGTIEITEGVRLGIGQLDQIAAFGTERTIVIPGARQADSNNSTSELLECSNAALRAAWNAPYNSDYPLGLGPYAVKGAVCSETVALAFISQEFDDLGNPDFGSAVFVVADAYWVPVARLRVPDPTSDAPTLIEAGLTTAQIDEWFSLADETSADQVEAGAILDLPAAVRSTYDELVRLATQNDLDALADLADSYDRFEPSCCDSSGSNRDTWIQESGSPGQFTAALLDGLLSPPRQDSTGHWYWENGRGWPDTAYVTIDNSGIWIAGAMLGY